MNCENGYGSNAKMSTEADPRLFRLCIKISGVPDRAAQLKPRSAGWDRAGWELNTLDG